MTFFSVRFLPRSVSQPILFYIRSSALSRVNSGALRAIAVLGEPRGYVPMRARLAGEIPREPAGYGVFTGDNFEDYSAVSHHPGYLWVRSGLLGRRKRLTNPLILGGL
jgi:hypothetical protein